MEVVLGAAFSPGYRLGLHHGSQGAAKEQGAGRALSHSCLSHQKKWGLSQQSFALLSYDLSQRTWVPQVLQPLQEFYQHHHHGPQPPRTPLLR